ncbi:MAG: hypothetical protein R3330_04265, partial [Saprospiraceae bacterium]|nr:hypothetical protein [Saprospiraceae bacterium]
FTWNQLPATGKLQHLQALASQFSPFLGDLKIYHTRRIQILSFLGEICDRYVLDRLALPFKEMGDDGIVSTQHITEALLEVRKPVVLLVRDQMLGYALKEQLMWQYAVLDLVAQCEIPVLNVWSLTLKEHGIAALDGMVENMRELAHRRPSSVPQTESTTLGSDDRTESAGLQGPVASEATSSETSDLRSNTQEVGGIPA